MYIVIVPKSMSSMSQYSNQTYLSQDTCACVWAALEDQIHDFVRHPIQVAQRDETEVAQRDLPHALPRREVIIVDNLRNFIMVTSADIFVVGVCDLHYFQQKSERNV